MTGPRANRHGGGPARLERLNVACAQVAGAAGKSPEAALVKICDKISNVRSVGATPPQDWPAARRGAYLDWAEEVVARLPAVPAAARLEFAATLGAARRAVAAGC